MSNFYRHVNLGQLTSLVHHRWNVLIVAELHRHSGAKFVTLRHSLAVSRGSLSASLSDLIGLGFVRRNTRHGHPMRPEYLLTKKGSKIGNDCATLVNVIQQRDEIDIAFRKWTLPLVAAIGERRLRFNELRSTLREATPRAITLGLKSLLREDWATRIIVDDFPPTAGYELEPRGRQILTCLTSLYNPD